MPKTKNGHITAARTLVVMAVFIAVFMAVLLTGCADAAAPDVEKADAGTAKTGTADGMTYRLESGMLHIQDDHGATIWSSDADWWVDDFRLGDVTGDGRTDVLFSLWKPYSFGSKKPERVIDDDAAVRNHLFLYTVKGGYAKPVWCSSGLPRPILSFELDPNGPKSPVSSGMILATEEGAYDETAYEADARSKSNALVDAGEARARYLDAAVDGKACRYLWEGWGFVPE
jgi:hypothetical protein